MAVTQRRSVRPYVVPLAFAREAPFTNISKSIVDCESRMSIESQDDECSEYDRYRGLVDVMRCDARRTHIEPVDDFRNIEFRSMLI